MITKNPKMATKQELIDRVKLMLGSYKLSNYSINQVWIVNEFYLKHEDRIDNAMKDIEAQYKKCGWSMDERAECFVLMKQLANGSVSELEGELNKNKQLPRPFYYWHVLNYGRAYQQNRSRQVGQVVFVGQFHGYL